MAFTDLETITPDEFRRALLKDQDREVLEEIRHEQELRKNIDYAIATLNIDSSMTVGQLVHAVKMLNSWGHAVTIADILDII